MKIPKDPFRKNRYKFEAATLLCVTMLGGTVAASPCRYCSQIHGINVTPAMTKTAMTGALFQLYSAPPHCRPSTRQTRETSIKVEANGSNCMTFFRKVLFSSSPESMARSAGKQKKMMMSTTAPMGRLTGLRVSNLRKFTVHRMANLRRNVQKKHHLHDARDVKTPPVI